MSPPARSSAWQRCGAARAGSAIESSPRRPFRRTSRSRYGFWFHSLPSSSSCCYGDRLHDGSCRGTPRPCRRRTSAIRRPFLAVRQAHGHPEHRRRTEQRLSVPWRASQFLAEVSLGRTSCDALCTIAGRGPEPPSGSVARLTARAFSRGNLESARAHGLEIWRLNKTQTA